MKTDLVVVFYRTEVGNEPVRDWLKGLPKAERQAIGEDIRAAQLGWPLGEPLIKKLDHELWEIRSRLSTRIARVIVTRQGNTLILLHGFIKKTDRIPKEELDLAKKRLSNLKS